MNESDKAIYGLMAEFKTPDRLIEAEKKACEEGYQEIGIYTPFPVEGLRKTRNQGRNRIALSVLVGGCIAGIGIYFVEYYSAVINYPINVGGRPYHSWPAFIPVVVEVAILGAVLGAVISMFLLNGLPKLYHPVFNVPQFERATRDGFFLCIKASDPRFDEARTKQFLENLAAVNVYGVGE